jgi:hypothetical protein
MRPSMRTSTCGQVCERVHAGTTDMLGIRNMRTSTRAPQLQHIARRAKRKGRNPFRVPPQAVPMTCRAMRLGLPAQQFRLTARPTLSREPLCLILKRYRATAPICTFFGHIRRDITPAAERRTVAPDGALARRVSHVATRSR